MRLEARPGSESELLDIGTISFTSHDKLELGNDAISVPEFIDGGDAVAETKGFMRTCEMQTSEYSDHY